MLFFVYFCASFYAVSSMIKYLSLSAFSPQQQLLLSIGFLLFLTSLFFFFKRKTAWAVGTLTLAGCLFFIFAAISDPYLHFWDERFHALVAKNCMDDPFAPKLYREWLVEQYPKDLWSHGYIWLHKQPLFLWQIALCFKLFGVSVFTLRLPSIIMSTLMIPLTYRIGSLLIDKKLGYFAAISATFSYLLVDMVAGGNMDHNNVCFFFYVTASLWAFMEYIRSGRQWKWLIMMALASGCAVLTKWLVGLLVYLVWGVYVLAEYHFCIKEWKIAQIVAAAMITAAVFVPWQIYTAKAFPKYFETERWLEKQHMTSVLEGHDGNATFFLKTIPYRYVGDKDYGTNVSAKDADKVTVKRVIALLLVLGGFAWLVFRCKKWSHRIALFVPVAFVYIFFSCAATKMVAYTFCLCSVGFMSLGMILCQIQSFLEQKVQNKWAYCCLFGLTASFFALYQSNLNWLKREHTPQVGYYEISNHNLLEYKRLAEVTSRNTVVFNVRGSIDWGNQAYPIEAMFFTDAICYPWAPTEEEFRQLVQAGWKVAISTAHDVPEFMLENADVQLVALDLWEDY